MQFSSVFKQLLIITSVKLNALSNEVGYDSSYLSRFSTGKLLPKGKNAPILFRKLAVYFAKQIRAHNLIDLVSKEFNINNDLRKLEDELYELLTISYQESIGQINSDTQSISSQILFTADQLAEFFLNLVEDELVIFGNEKLLTTIIDQLRISKRQYEFSLVTNSFVTDELSEQLLSKQPNLVISQIPVEDDVQFCLLNQLQFFSLTYFDQSRTYVVLQSQMTNAQLNFIKTYLSNVKSC